MFSPDVQVFELGQPDRPNGQKGFFYNVTLHRDRTRTLAYDPGGNAYKVGTDEEDANPDVSLLLALGQRMLKLSGSGFSPAAGERSQTQTGTALALSHERILSCPFRLHSFRLWHSFAQAMMPRRHLSYGMILISTGRSNFCIKFGELSCPSLTSENFSPPVSLAL